MTNTVDTYFGPRMIHFSFLRDGMAGDPFFQPDMAEPDRWQQAHKVGMRRARRGRYRPRLKPSLPPPRRAWPASAYRPKSAPAYAATLFRKAPR
jgi:hypothetical protein